MFSRLGDNATSTSRWSSLPPRIILLEFLFLSGGV
jgi:hypothetical protein